MTISCSELKNILQEHITGKLSPEAGAAVEEHLQECASCREYLTQILKDDRMLDAWVDNLSGTVERIERNVIAELESPGNRVVAFRPGFFQRYRILRYAALALLMIGAFLVYDLVSFKDDTFTHWEEVLAKVQKARTVYWTMDLKEGNDPAVQVKQYYSADYGLRQDITVQDQVVANAYYSYADKELVTLLPQSARYFIICFDLDKVFDEELNKDARNLIVECLNYKHIQLDNREINGRMAAGIRIDDPAFVAGEFDTVVADLWVDIENHYPLQLEYSTSFADGKVSRTMVFRDFCWDEDIDAAMFDYTVPDNFALVFKTDEIKDDLESAIKGLRDFAEIGKGRFPSTLSYNTARYELNIILEGKALTQEEIVKLFNIVSTSVFYRDRIKDDHEFRYYGAHVMFGEADKLLMRWKLQGDTFQAVFGDLHVENLTRERIRELEQ